MLAGVDVEGDETAGSFPEILLAEHQSLGDGLEEDAGFVRPWIARVRETATILVIVIGTVRRRSGVRRAVVPTQTPSGASEEGGRADTENGSTCHAVHVFDDEHGK